MTPIAAHVRAHSLTELVQLHLRQHCIRTGIEVTDVFVSGYTEPTVGRFDATASATFPDGVIAAAPLRFTLPDPTAGSPTCAVGIGTSYIVSQGGDFEPLSIDIMTALQESRRLRSNR